jgi:Na+-transporting methylmalonyl-CoA/oxaloacetate decarboxylase gamma subunit
VLTLVAATAAVLGATLVLALIAVLVFLIGIRGFLAETAATLDTVEERATRLAARIERVQGSTAAAARELSTRRR